MARPPASPPPPGGGRGEAGPSPRTPSHSLSPSPPSTAKWDFGRFLKTVTFFNPPEALLGRLMRTLTGGQSVADALAAADAAASASPGNPRRGGVVLVTGATGGLGRRVVARLLARGEAVRAVARDAAKAATMLEGLPRARGGSLEVVLADLAQPATLPPALGDRVRAVISCAAVVVRPKEGDTPDRAKYLQGVCVRERQRGWRERNGRERERRREREEERDRREMDAMDYGLRRQ